MPNFAVIRPADANEVTQAWKSILLREKPVGLFLSRQNLPTVDRTTHGDAAGLDKGAYVLKEASSSPDVVIIATGSEVGLALEVQKVLEGKNVSTRVVSAPCLEWFNEEGAAYREKVLPSSAKLRVSIEAGVAQGWREYVGDNGLIISLEHFGASAGAAKLFNEFGFSVEKIVADIEGALK
jgi:transketolase